MMTGYVIRRAPVLARGSHFYCGERPTGPDETMLLESASPSDARRFKHLDVAEAVADGLARRYRLTFMVQAFTDPSPVDHRS